MPQIQLTERLYEEIQRRANVAGFDTVDAYVADVLEQDVDEGAAADRLFTPEVLADLDRIEAGTAAGERTYSSTEVDGHFRERRKAWMANAPA